MKQVSSTYRLQRGFYLRTIAMDFKFVTTFASVVVIMALLMVDSSWATHRKVLSKSDSSASPIFNVMDYGAHAGGLKDDRTAFIEAWEAACMASSNAVLQVPLGKTFLINPVTFLGPCKSHISVEITGTIVAPNKQSAWNSDELNLWIRFYGISGLTIEGGGVIDGQGQDWWSKSCKVNNQEAMTISGCSNVLIKNLQFVNSPRMHLVVVDSSAIQLNGLQIQAPEQSPNTDGIHLQRVKNAQINNCVIQTGDDCISISSGSSTINIKNIKCGPGHGISIGSLGKNGEEAKIDDILVQNITFVETSNGARIKTWQFGLTGGGSGYARNIIFEDIVVHNVKNPIIIDQYYCDSASPCKIQPSAVQIQDVTYRNIQGTSSTDVAVNFSCSKTVACTGITLTNVEITSTTANKVKSVCANALGMALGTILPPSCLKN
eukprot:PITA_13764